MGRSAITGSFGVGRQSAKDNAAGSLMYLPATAVSLSPQQNVATLPPEVGGSYFLRGSYKASFSSGGETSLVVRPTGLGNLLLAYGGVDTVTGVVGQSGAYSHAVTPFAPAPGVDLPWMTLQENVANLYTEQYLNTKMRSLRLDVPKSAIATAQVSWFGTTPSCVSPATGVSFDSTPQFQTSVGSVSLMQEGSNTNISANSIKMERFTFTCTNQLSEDEFSVGNLFADDVTLLQRTITVDADIVVRDTALYSAVYYNGAALPAAVSPTIYRGTLLVTLTSGINIPTTTQPYQLSLYFPGLDFMMMPIALQGADLVRATLSTQVTLGPSGSDTFLFTLINGVASY